MTTLQKSLFAAVVLTAGFIGGLVVSGRMSLTQPSTAAPRPDADAQAQAPASSRAPAIANALPDLSSIAEAALKVSVNISSTTTVQRQLSPFDRFFFGDVNPVERSQSLGSGVVVRPDGYVITNTHVIGNAGADIRVTLPNGVEKPGTLVGIDEISDVAVVKVDATNLQTLPWGDSTKLRVAEWVLAIGNPFQLSGTVTLGIVSAINRSGRYSDFIQTDAAINPGNSGGALVNARGELIGINTMIVSGTGGYQGIGLAIPSMTARGIMDELIKNGSVTWGDIGRIQWVTIDRESARRYGLGDIEGSMVYSIGRSSAAYRAGLQPEDIVVSFNGAKVADAEQLDRLIIQSKPGTRAKLDVVRDGRRTTIEVPVVSRQSQVGAVRR
jgi:S1-C subfamily serine protease